MCGLMALTIATGALTQRIPAVHSLMMATELRPDQRGHFVTDAEINGTTIKVIIDTGATAVALSFQDADNAGLRPNGLDYDVPVNTANGLVKAAKVTLRRVEVDGVEVRDVEGLVLPDGVMTGTLLGMSYLSRLREFGVRDGVLHLEN
jgi:aspartyl protease family protein